jgi:hypothetical protein
MCNEEAASVIGEITAKPENFYYIHWPIDPGKLCALIAAASSAGFLRKPPLSETMSMAW